jgi:hypothetical protein
MRVLLWICLLVLPELLLAQMSISGDLYAQEGSIVSINTELINDGDFTSAGEIHLMDSVLGDQFVDFTGAKVYLTGQDQFILNLKNVESLEIRGGGIKQFEHGVAISKGLYLTNGLIKAETTSATQVIGGDSLSYVIGQLKLQGADSLHFPMGDETHYWPIAISDLLSKDSVSASFHPESPVGKPGKGLLTLANEGYWQLDYAAKDQGRIFIPSNQDGQSKVMAGSQMESGLYHLIESEESLNGQWIQSEPTLLPSLITYGTYFDENLKKQDSLGLVSIFDQTNGEHWTQNDNWLSDSIKHWHGITVRDKRVTDIDLSKNNLAGAINFPSQGLEKVASLDLKNNELTNLDGIEVLESIQEVYVDENRLQFEPLEEILSTVTNYSIDNQKRVLDSIRTLNEIGSLYEVDRKVSGSSNTYEWYRNGEQIDTIGTGFNVEVTDFSVEAEYYAKVINDRVPGLTLTTQPVIVLVSSIERDSTALTSIYDKMDGDSWQELSDWNNLPIENWEEVTLTGNRVVALDLSGKGLSGEMPYDILDITEMTDINLSGNQIEEIPDFSELPLIESLDLSDNHLQFASLEPNAGLQGMVYAPQKPFGLFDSLTYQVGDQGEVFFDVSGSINSYQWTRNDEAINHGTHPLLQIDPVNYETMGTYNLEVKNDLLPDLTLVSNDQIVLALSSVNINPFYLDAQNEQNKLEEGEAFLFRIKSTGPYDTLGFEPDISNGITFENIVLGDYLVLVSTDKKLEESINNQDITVELLPTYYKNSIDWVEADTLELREAFSDDLTVERLVTGLESGTGNVDLLVESEFITVTDDGARIEARRRVSKAGCSLRKRTVSGGGRTEEDEWEIVAYQETDDNGEVNFGFLPQGFYRLNIQYPGIPMDPNSFIEFEISEEEEKNGYQLNALITEEAITVTLEEALGLSKTYFDGLNVYPVPADKQVNITFKELKRSHVEIRLINLRGDVLFKKQLIPGANQEVSFDVDQVTESVYLVQFVDQSNLTRPLVTYKLIVRH